MGFAPNAFMGQGMVPNQQPLPKTGNWLSGEKYQLLQKGLSQFKLSVTEEELAKGQCNHYNLNGTSALIPDQDGSGGCTCAICGTHFTSREFAQEDVQNATQNILDILNTIKILYLSIDPNAVIYGEGWAASSPLLPAEQLAMKANTARLGGIAAFGDEMRDGLRGGWSNNDEGAFIIGNGGNEESVKFGIVGAIAHPGVDFTKVNYSKEPWAAQPQEMISYVSCHDDMCLADRIKHTLTHKDGKADKQTRMRLQKLTETAVLTSQGVPFIWCGDEIMRDKKGVHNSFSSPDSINQIPWAQKTEYKEVFDYIASLVSMRKSHPAFRMGDADMVRRNLKFLPVKQQNVIAWKIDGREAGDTWSEIIIILNSNSKAVKQAVPKGRYNVVCSNGKADMNGLGEVNSSKVVVPGQTALIMYR